MKSIEAWVLCRGGRNIVFLICLCFFSSPSYGGGNYWGTTGLIRTPNGRVIEDGDLRFTFSNSYPYRNYAVAFGFFPFLELNGRITELLDQKLSGSGWEKYGYYKDKAADFKLLIFSEREWAPSFSIGAQDFHGTQLFFNEYVAASKKIDNLDFTLGYGGNLFGSIFKEENTETRELKGVFGGIEWKLRPNLSFLFEYDPTDKLALNSKVKIESHFNYGIRWEPLRWLKCGYSFQRGNEHSFYLAFTWPFGAQIQSQKPDEPFFGSVNRAPIFSPVFKTYSKDSEIPERLSRIRDLLVEEGFIDVKVTLSLNKKSLYIEYENRKYLSEIKGLGRALRVVIAQYPSDVEMLHIIVKSNNIPMFTVSLNPRDFADFLNGKLTSEEILGKIQIIHGVSKHVYLEKDREIAAGSVNPSVFSCRFKPFEIETYWNDPSGFLKGRIGPTVLLKEDFGKGLSAETYLRFPFFSNVKTDLSAISDKPIRSDIVDYLQNTGVEVDLFVNKFFRLGDSSFGRLTAGYLELQFAGISAEYLKIIKDGRFGLGGEISVARKRDPDSVFGLEDYTSITPFLNSYMFMPELNTTLQTSFGKFLGGDIGAKFQITRYIRGGSVFLWYTNTDTSGFTGPNKGYADKGVGFTLPITIFRNHDCQGSYKYAFSPWSRDVGQKISQVYSLYDFIFDFTPVYISSHWSEITE